MPRQISETPEYILRHLRRCARNNQGTQFDWWDARLRYLEDRDDGSTLRDLRTDPQGPRAAHPPTITHDRTD